MDYLNSWNELGLLSIVYSDILLYKFANGSVNIFLGPGIIIDITI